MTLPGLAILISCGSLLLAGLSLGWQVAQWLLSAARPRAELRHGLLARGSIVCGTVSKEGVGCDVAQLLMQGFTGSEVLGILVTNHGRASLSVDRVAVRARGGKMSLVPTTTFGPDLPYTIQPGTNASWYMPLEQAEMLLAAARAANDPVTGLYMAAELGTGRTIHTPTTFSAASRSDRPDEASA